jgi:hypothetical protein
MRYGYGYGYVYVYCMSVVVMRAAPNWATSQTDHFTELRFIVYSQGG